MQLFITEFQKKENIITVENTEILNQIRKVLRMKIWDSLFVQNEDARYELEIVDRNDKSFSGKIKNKIQFDWNKNQNWIAIAMPNKRDKIELLIQKISEIWIKNIYFWPSERSIIRERSNKKDERLKKIAKEAIEQSWWWFIPEIKFVKNISEIIWWKNIIIFDKSDENNTYNFNEKNENILGIIWPEWWLTKNDYKKIWKNHKIISLWDTVLRTETAWIIAAWLIKNTSLS